MKITKAIFSGSSRFAKDRPKPRLPEFAFIGRSNVGKSSLINMLCNNKSLAHTSSKPGKTQLINHFMINDKWYLVDLPGYGYAKLPKKTRMELDEIIKSYINGSEELVSLFVLLDCRHDILPNDLRFIMQLGEAEVPFSIIYTKSDKLSSTALEKQIGNNNQILLEYWEELPPVFISSAVKGTGKEEILSYIETFI
jgi:GTP-binding protein